MRRVALVVAGAIGALIGLAAFALLCIAYLYEPPEDRSEVPQYLAAMRAAGTDHFIDAGNFRLHYLKVGAGAPVVLLPGGGGWIYEMRDLAAALAPYHTVYVIDPPGDGYTTAIPSQPDYDAIYTLDSIDASLLAFMKRMGLSRAALVGNSWGGGYGLYFAEMHPDRVTKYISLDGTGLDLDDTGGSLMWSAAKWPVLGEAFFKLGASRSDVRSYLHALFVHREVSDDAVSEYAIPYSFRPNLISQWILERNLDWKRTERLLPKLRAPTLIIWGKQDNILLERLYVPRWRALKPKAKIVEIDDAGHAVLEDQPGKVNSAVLRFLDEQQPQP